MNVYTYIHSSLDIFNEKNERETEYYKRALVYPYLFEFQTNKADYCWTTQPKNALPGRLGVEHVHYLTG